MLNNVTDGPMRDFWNFRTDLHPKRSKSTGTVSVPVGPLGQGAGVCDPTEVLTITDRQTDGRRVQTGPISLKFVHNTPPTASSYRAVNTQSQMQVAVTYCCTDRNNHSDHVFNPLAPEFF